MLQTTVRAALVAALALLGLAACTPNNAPIASQNPAAAGPSKPSYAQPGTQTIPPGPEPATAPPTY